MYTCAYARLSHNIQAQINSLQKVPSSSEENKSLSELMQNEMSFKGVFTLCFTETQIRMGELRKGYSKSTRASAKQSRKLFLGHEARVYKLKFKK